jgi:hypothetical protein
VIRSRGEVSMEIGPDDWISDGGNPVLCRKR